MIFLISCVLIVTLILLIVYLIVMYSEWKAASSTMILCNDCIPIKMKLKEAQPFIDQNIFDIKINHGTEVRYLTYTKIIKHKGSLDYDEYNYLIVLPFFDYLKFCTQAEIKSRRKKQIKDLELKKEFLKFLQKDVDRMYEDSVNYLYKAKEEMSKVGMKNEI